MFPHSLNARTFITSHEKTITLKVRKDSKAYVSMDSHNNLKVNSDRIVKIRKAAKELTLIHPTDHSFFLLAEPSLVGARVFPLQKSS